MTDILYIIDDADIVHWKIYDPGDQYSSNETRDWAINMKLKGWPIHTFLKDADEKTLEDLGDYLFDMFHASDAALTDYLLNRFDHSVDYFVNYLEENFKRDSLKNIRDKLIMSLER